MMSAGDDPPRFMTVGFLNKSHPRGTLVSCHWGLEFMFEILFEGYEPQDEGRRVVERNSST